MKKVLSSLFASLIILTSCNLNLDKENKANLVKAENLQTVVNLDFDSNDRYFDKLNKKTVDYRLITSSSLLLVTDNKDIIQTFNNYVKDTNVVIYYMTSSSYKNFNTFYETDQKLENTFKFSVVENVIERASVEATSINQNDIKNFVSKYTNPTNYYSLNIDVNSKVTVNGLELVYENDYTNAKIIFGDNYTEEDYIQGRNLPTSATNYQNKIKNLDYVYFGRKTCSDCQKFDSYIRDAYIDKKITSKTGLFDIFIFQYHINDGLYDLSRSFLKSDEVGARFKYYTSSSNQENTYSFVTPLIVKLENGAVTNNTYVFANTESENGKIIRSPYKEYFDLNSKNLDQFSLDEEILKKDIENFYNFIK